jgi:hypothetical protein
MTVAEWSQVGIAAALGVVAIAKTIQWVWGRRNGNGNDPAKMLLEAVKEQTGLLREIKDKLLCIDHGQIRAIDGMVRVEQAMGALHRRFDSVVGTRE